MRIGDQVFTPYGRGAISMMEFLPPIMSSPRWKVCLDDFKSIPAYLGGLPALHARQSGLYFCEHELREEAK